MTKFIQLHSAYIRTSLHACPFYHYVNWILAQIFQSMLICKVLIVIMGYLIDFFLFHFVMQNFVE